MLSRSKIIFWLCLLVLFALALSVFIFSKQSLRLDEAQSLWQTSRSTPTVIQIIAQDVHVPLYHLILHFWQFMFGNGIATARSLSLLFFLLMIPATYKLGKLLFNDTVGLFGAVLVAISPFLNWYGNEIRMYSLFALLTILNQYFFSSLFVRNTQREGEERESGYWIGYALTLILGMFAHYFFLLNIVTQAIFFVFYRNIFPKNAMRNFIIILLVAGAIFAPWLALVIKLGGAGNNQPALIEPTSVDLFNTFSQFIFGFQNDHINTILVSLWPLLVLLVFLSLRRNQKIMPQTVYLFFSLFLPIIIVFIVSTELRPVYLSRYLILTLPSLYLLISWILATYPKNLSRMFRMALIVIMLGTLTIEIVNANTPVKENYESASDFLTENARPQDIIVVSAPFTIYPVEYYYRGSAQLETLPIWNRYAYGPIPTFSEDLLVKDVETLKGAHQAVWLLLSYDQGYEEAVRLYFDTHFERLMSRNFSPGLNLYAYKLRYDNQDLDEILKNLQREQTETATSTLRINSNE